MRDPERLLKYYVEIEEIHKKEVPDWRIGQVLVNFQRWLGRDIFYIEDEELVNLFRKFLVDNIKY